MMAPARSRSNRFAATAAIDAALRKFVWTSREMRLTSCSAAA
jgi:hypothetical protein